MKFTKIKFAIISLSQKNHKTGKPLNKSMSEYLHSAAEQSELNRHRLSSLLIRAVNSWINESKMAVAYFGV